MGRKTRYADGGSLVVGAYQPQPPTSAGAVDRSQTTSEVLNNMQSANNPTIMAKKGGYIKAADGCVTRGKTRGKLV